MSRSIVLHEIFLHIFLVAAKHGKVFESFSKDIFLRAKKPQSYRSRSIHPKAYHDVEGKRKEKFGCRKKHSFATTVPRSISNIKRRKKRTYPPARFLGDATRGKACLRTHMKCQTVTPQTPHDVPTDFAGAAVLSDTLRGNGARSILEMDGVDETPEQRSRDPVRRILAFVRNHAALTRSPAMLTPRGQISSQFSPAKESANFRSIS